MTNRIWVLIPAAGKGSRFERTIPKQYQMVLGKSLLAHTLHALRSAATAETIVVLSPDDEYWQHSNLAEAYSVQICQGGTERYLSVERGLNLAVSLGANEQDWVLIHDAARPCLHPKTLRDLLLALASEQRDGLILAVPCRDTMKQSMNGKVIQRTVDRALLWQAQTPQCFRLGALKEALMTVKKSGVQVTDEAEAVERNGGQVGLFLGRYDNIKVTFPEDLELAKAILSNAHSH